VQSRGRVLQEGASCDPLRIIPCILSMIGVCASARQVTSHTPAHGKRIKRIVIAATKILDGKGRVLPNTRIVIKGGKIVALDAGIQCSATPWPRFARE
jgi:hypothetical protein